MRIPTLGLGMGALVVLGLGCSGDDDRPGPIGASGGAAQAGSGGSANGGRSGGAGRGGSGQGGSGASGAGATSGGGTGGGSGSGGTGGGVPSECSLANPASCTGETACRCCPHASGGEVCLCVVPCSDGTDCTDPERPYCDLEGTAGGMCVEDDAFCCWDC